MTTVLNNNELYIVTGAAGNLGSAIVRHLVANGKAVRSFVLRGEEAAKHLPEGANVYEGDVTDVSTLNTLFSDIPENTAVYCIHCAAMVSVSNLVADKIWHVNVDGTQNIIDQCKAHGARLIFIGSTGAIPEEPKGTVIREVEHFDPNAVIGIYDQTKAASCQLVLDAIHAGEIDGCLILPSGISGPGDYTFGNVAGVIKEYVEGKMPAGVEGTFNCADNRDMAETIVRACREGRSGESYILGGDQIGMKEVFDILAEHTGLPTIKTILPAGMGKFLGSIVLIVLAILVFANLALIGKYLPTLVGFLMILSSLAEIVRSFSLKSGGLKSWWLGIVPALIVLILGFVFLLKPGFVGASFGIFTGITLVINGIAAVVNFFQLKK